jgi:cytosine/adenosine deaminase-related metal-dependent hydrolase
MSGVMSVHRMAACGITVGLGSDVSGGYSPSMLDCIRQAIIASKVKRIEDGTSPPLTYKHGLSVVAGISPAITERQGRRKKERKKA